MKIYNKYLDKAVRTIDSVQPTFGQEKTRDKDGDGSRSTHACL